MNDVRYLRIEIQPWRPEFPNQKERQLSIKINVDGQDYFLQQVIQRDDLTSFYDQLFHMAKEMIRDKLGLPEAKP
jgi:hypothetical protein